MYTAEQLYIKKKVKMSKLSKWVSANLKGKNENSFETFWAAVFGETQDCESAALFMLTRTSHVQLLFVTHPENSS